MSDAIVRTVGPGAAGRVLDAQRAFGRGRDDTAAPYGLIVRAPAMRLTWRHAQCQAPHARAVVITGALGVGKLFLAQVVHQLGPVRHGPWTVLDIAGATDDGPAANTGVRSGRTWLIPRLEALTDAGQVALVAALASSEAQPVGEGVHVIATSSVDPVHLMADGRLRADLYFRLNVARLHMPSLAERLDDLPELAPLLLREACRRGRLEIKTLASSAVDLIVERPWPGNARELRNVLARAAMLTDEPVIGAHTVREACALETPRPASTRPTVKAARHVDPSARARVAAALSAAGGNKSVAALQLGLSRRALYRLLDRLDA